jgi:hypothetical protein
LKKTPFQSEYILTTVFALLLASLLLIPPALGPPAQPSLRDRARGVFEIEGVVYVDERDDGKLEIGVAGKGVVRAVETRLGELGIPLERVRVVETKPIQELATLRDEIRPLIGGLQISFVKSRSTYLCTLGFIAVRTSDSRAGFLTNSHCTSKEFAYDGTVHYQPLPGTDTRVGAEISDPQAFDCGVGRLKCRWSDAALSSLEAAGDLGYIAATSGVNDGSLALAGYYKIALKHEGNAEIGTILRKVGRTTGQTEGIVTNTCADVRPSGSRVIRLCQDIVSSSTTIVRGGDSGSPVFMLNDNPESSPVEVVLYGILWGGSSDGTMFVYSPITNVERDLGPLQVN